MSNLTSDTKGDILIVDDIPENLHLLSNLLIQQGYKVRSVTSGKMALIAAQAKPPNIILLDIKMPEMDGYQVCGALKSNPETVNIPVIFISALDEIIDKVTAFQVGGVDYITKPFQIEEVVARIENQIIIQRQKKQLETEIEQRKQIEEILIQSRALISSVLNSALDGIAAVQSIRDNQGVIKDFKCLVVNPVIAKIFRKKTSEIIDRLVIRKILNKLDPNLFEKLVQVVETSKTLAEDFYYETEETKTWYHFIAVKFSDGFVITIRDITKRKIYELKLLESNKNLEAFSYSLSHDLRNYLSHISSCIYLLQQDYSQQLGEKGQEFLDIIAQSGSNMEQIIEALLLLSQVDHCHLLIESVNLSSIAQDIGEKLQYKEPDRQVEFIVAGNIMAIGDKRLLKIALENLINNAWKYSAKQNIASIEFGIIPVEEQKNLSQLFPILESSSAIYFIRDNGIGFDLNQAQEIFAPFQRLDTSKEFEGIGIGLSTVQRIIHRHGGKICCDAMVNHGATFYFTLESHQAFLESIIIEGDSSSE